MVIDKHREFARAVAALARAYNMTGLQVSFRLGFLRDDGEVVEPGQFEQVEMHWTQGRHGAQAQITLTTRGHETIWEKDKSPQ